MADNSLQQIVLEAFQLARGAEVNLAELVRDLLPREALGEVTRQLEGVRTVSQVLSDVVAVNTQAVEQNTSAQGGKGVAQTIGKAATSFLGSGLGLAPLVTGLVRLFGGGKPEAPPPLFRFTPPPPVRFDAANAPLGAGAVGLPAVDYGQDGRPRFVPPPAERQSPQITVQVQAMDSRSFLDHSHEIARAVRDAMLNMHALNDVVTDL